MKIIPLMAVIGLMVSSQAATAALPPSNQNVRDLKVMVSFIEANKDVAVTLKHIDFSNFTVFYGDNCAAVFARKSILRPAGWVGPAAPLELKSVDCDDTS